MKNPVLDQILSITPGIKSDGQVTNIDSSELILELYPNNKIPKV